MPASTPRQDNSRPLGEVDWIGSVGVLWPLVRCAACQGPSPQRHGLPLLTVEDRPTCASCYPVAAARGLRLARQVVGAGGG